MESCLPARPIHHGVETSPQGTLGDLPNLRTSQTRIVCNTALDNWSLPPDPGAAQETLPPCGAGCHPVFVRLRKAGPSVQFPKPETRSAPDIALPLSPESLPVLQSNSGPARRPHHLPSLWLPPDLPPQTHPEAKPVTSSSPPRSHIPFPPLSSPGQPSLPLSLLNSCAPDPTSRVSPGGACTSAPRPTARGHRLCHRLINDLLPHQQLHEK